MNMRYYGNSLIIMFTDVINRFLSSLSLFKTKGKDRRSGKTGKGKKGKERTF